MVEQSEQRRLAAILAGDMVGYSRLMEADERGTIARQLDHRNELIDPKIAEHHGRIVKTTGDGMIVEFASVVDAVECAVAVQHAMTEREKDVSEDRRIQYRFGINVGDVVDQDGDLLGAGVNVAARLEGLAEPGGICISRTARDQVRDLLNVALEDMGEVEVKNIARPVRVFRVLGEAETVSSMADRTATWQRYAVPVAVLAALVAGGLWWWQPWIEREEPARAERMAFPLPSKPSIVVLPFDNMSGDSEQEYFVDGLTERIISQLSKSSRIFVIARNSAFTYKSKPVKMRQVSEELGVRYVLEGSYQRTGDQIRVHAQLIDAITGYHIWSEQYDRTASEIFDVQDDITLNIASTIGGVQGQIALAEQTEALRKESKNLEVWDHIRRGRGYFFQFKKDTNLLARKEAMKIIELDPKNAGAYASVGWTHLAEVWLGVAKRPENSYARAEKWARKAIAIDEQHHQGHYLLAYVHVAEGHFARASAEFEKALKLAPNDAVVLYTYGMRYLVPVGKSEEALTVMRKAMRLNPHHREHLHGMLSYPLYMLGRYDEAIATINRQTKPRIDVRAILAGSYAQLGQMEKARAIVEKILSDRPDYTIKKFANSQRFKNPKDAERWVAGPRKAGLPE